jgi:hypothetical protein
MIGRQHDVSYMQEKLRRATTCQLRQDIQDRPGFTDSSYKGYRETSSSSPDQLCTMYTAMTKIEHTQTECLIYDTISMAEQEASKANHHI